MKFARLLKLADHDNKNEAQEKDPQEAEYELDGGFIEHVANIIS